MSFMLRCHPALVVRKHDIIILRYLASVLFGPIQLLKSTCGFRNIKCFTGKGYWPFAQPPTWRTRCCSSSDLSPESKVNRVNEPLRFPAVHTNYERPGIDHFHIPHYWSGTTCSFQWRLMWGNIIIETTTSILLLIQTHAQSVIF